MKRILMLFTVLSAVFFLDLPGKAQTPGIITDTVTMGPGYVNEIYYSMANGNMGAVNRKQWDIAFRASRMSASILTNDAANNNPIGLNGVELYTYGNSDTSGWATFDTTGLSTWKLLGNSTTDWETGAFCQNQLGHPDYGWGRYNSASHDVVGDSLYLIKLRDGSLRKLWIMRKYSSLNTYEFRYANLDGSGDTTVVLDCNPYSDKNFVGFSLTTNQVVDFEPVSSTDWDILFTKYMYTYPDGVLYPVTGVLSNYDIKVNKFEHVAPDFRAFDPAAMDSSRSAIGWDWKYLDGSFVYHVVDSLMYFVQDKSGNIHRLVFKEFAGSSTGRIVLQKELISLAGIDDRTSLSANLGIYPNPAVYEANLVLNPGNSRTVRIVISDLTGRLAWNEEYNVNRNELNTVKIPLESFSGGVYLLTVTTREQRLTGKLIVRN